MLVRVLDKYLPRSVRPEINIDDVRPRLLQMLLAAFEVIDLDREMIASWMFVNRSIQPLQQMQLAHLAKREPRPLKIERRSRFLLQTNYFFVEANTPGNIADTQRDMIEIENFDHEKTRQPDAHPIKRNSPSSKNSRRNTTLTPII